MNFNHDASFSFGEPSVFSINIRFEIDPDIHRYDMSIDDSWLDDVSSWGSFEIWANSKNLCAHTHQGEFESSVFWYLLPMIEWFESFTFGILEDDISDMPDYEIFQTHNLLGCREGGIFPDILFQRKQDMVEISWIDEMSTPGVPSHHRFIEKSGSYLVPPKVFIKVISELLEKTIDHLCEIRPFSSRLNELKRIFFEDWIEVNENNSV